MNLEILFEKIDHFKPKVILLEGKRDVLEHDKEKLFDTGRSLALNYPEVVFRSGNADGADYHFIQGVASVADSKIQIMTPYAGHKKMNLPSNAEIVSLCTIPADENSFFVVKAKALLSEYYGKQIETYLESLKINKPRANKSSYLLRDTLKVCGYEKISKADFAVFYDDLKKPETGGTGFTMKVCKSMDVPFMTQKWLF